MKTGETGMTSPPRPAEIAKFISSLTDPKRRSRIRRSLTRHTGLKLLSLTLAVALWLFVNAGQHQSQVSFEVPVSYNSLPARLLIINHHPRFIKLDVAGPRTLLSLVDPGRLTLRLDLAGVNQGQASFRISPEMFNLPRQTTITRIAPSQIVLDIDKLVSREMPVTLSLVGDAAHGYEVASSDLTPAEVTATGPSRFVNYLKRINTEPLSVAGAASDLDATVHLVDPGPRIHLAQYQVEAKVTVQPVIANREYKGIKVLVRNTDHKSEVLPGEANIVVRGPLLKLAKLDPDQAVFVEASGVTPGLHVLPVQVTLPDGLELVRQSPQRVKLRVYREKRAANG
jgi:YbbR domain-containing protein